MQPAPWREDVAALLTEMARALRANQDRHAVRALGTVLAYIERLSARGERGAEELLRLLRQSAGEQLTERFSFAPGELEEIKRRHTQG